MASYDPDLQARWDQIIGGFRTLIAVATLSLFFGLAVPVLLRQVPPAVLLLAVWSLLGWLLTWLMPHPPKSWKPPANPGLERRLARMRKISLLHLALFGGVDVVLMILVLERVLRQT